MVHAGSCCGRDAGLPDLSVTRDLVQGRFDGEPGSGLLLRRGRTRRWAGQVEPGRPGLLCSDLGLVRYQRRGVRRGGRWGSGQRNADVFTRYSPNLGAFGGCESLGGDVAGWTRARRREARRDKLNHSGFTPKKWGKRRRAARPAPRGANSLFLAELLRSYPTLGSQTTTVGKQQRVHLIPTHIQQLSPRCPLSGRSSDCPSSGGERREKLSIQSSFQTRERHHRFSGEGGAEVRGDASPRTDTNRRRPLTRKTPKGSALLHFRWGRAWRRMWPVIQRGPGPRSSGRAGAC